ncbi:DUF2795 domain-containing protein [Streptomyces misionensis]|uniref:DUF2795 domain-containing protein n=1 Tax=Streptomyces misionensis TaxID=67331 RepID=UPI0033AA61A6
MLDALQDVDFPAGKEELVKAAENAGAPEEVVKALHAVPPDEYGNRDNGQVGAPRPGIRPGPERDAARGAGPAQRPPRPIAAPA